MQKKIAFELAERYPEADADFLVGLIWLHDYAKIISIKDDKEGLTKSRELLDELGFDSDFSSRLIELLEIFESKMTVDLWTAPIEVRIVSTADAVSHMYGPFYQIFSYEHPEMTVEELMASNAGKLEKDWNRKIVLPGIKEELESRYQFLKESFGQYPERFLAKTKRRATSRHS